MRPLGKVTERYLRDVIARLDKENNVATDYEIDLAGYRYQNKKEDRLDLVAFLHDRTTKKQLRWVKDERFEVTWIINGNPLGPEPGFFHCTDHLKIVLECEVPSVLMQNDSLSVYAKLPAGVEYYNPSSKLKGIIREPLRFYAKLK